MRGLTTCEGTAIPSGKKCADTGDRGQSARIGSNRSPSVLVAVATWKEGRHVIAVLGRVTAVRERQGKEKNRNQHTCFAIGQPIRTVAGGNHADAVERKENAGGIRLERGGTRLRRER